MTAGSRRIHAIQAHYKRKWLTQEINFNEMEAPSDGLLLKHILQAYWRWIIEKWYQKREGTFSDDVLAVVNVPRYCFLSNQTILASFAIALWTQFSTRFVTGELSWNGLCQIVSVVILRKRKLSDPYISRAMLRTPLRLRRLCEL